MKKIIILLLSIFLLSGCYDNIELNNLSIITGVGIDYYDDEFHVTFEVLNDIKTEENTAMLSYTLNGHGSTITKAFTDANYRVGKKPYFAHLKIVLLGKEVLNGHLQDIMDYLLRDTNIRDEFYLFLTNDVTPEEVLSHNSKNYPVVSDLIMNLKDNEKYNNNLALDENYQEFLAKVISKNYDAIIGSISIIDNNITIDHFYLLKGYDIISSLTREESSLYNLLTTNTITKEVDKMYKDGNFSIGITNSNTSIEVLPDTININLKLKGKVIENISNFDLKKEETYKMLNEDFAKVLEDEITEFVHKLQTSGSDVLGLQEIYYKSTRKDNHNLWSHAKVKVNVSLQINTKGFIFEVIP